jgi:hypothetical protein
MPELPQRFWDKVNRWDPDWCWEWIGALYRGYPHFWTREHGRVRAHRLAYEALVGPIPEGMTLDHLCPTRHCVNPKHLEPVTHSVNLQRRHRSRRYRLAELAEAV